ncbi:ATP cone domain-containing protein [Vibrio lentus]|nr:ATP cone domain-containing protein [Vibrio lentus]
MKSIVIKRDGSRAPFSRDRIQAAVEAASDKAR